MIERYTRKEMGWVWSRQNRFNQMLKVEKAVASVQANCRIIPSRAGQVIQKKSTFSLKIIDQLEKKTKHDVSAFIQNVSQNIGSPFGRWFHYGLTSSDVLDTALSLQIKESSILLKKEFTQLRKILKLLILKHDQTLCAGRTHGMHAEPTTFGFKLLGFFSEILRAEKTFFDCISENTAGVISGPVGHYSALSMKIEKEVCRRLGLKPEPVSTQVIARDKPARVLFALCLITNCLERLAIELRHLQRTEVGEVEEGFSKGQHGSSSMPHKKNPISAENITGTARLLRAYLQAGLENTALWHERDISHSSVERVIFPDAFILCDYALERMAVLLKTLKVNTEKMKKNLFSFGGNIFSSQILLSLVDKGMDRGVAYDLVQKISHKKKDFYSEMASDKIVRKYLNLSELKKIFSGEKTVQRIAKIIKIKLKTL